MTRDETIRSRLTRWLARFNPPRIMEDNEQLQHEEFNSLFDCLDRYAPTNRPCAAFIDQALDAMEFEMTYRVWPTKGELARVCEKLTPRQSSSSAPGSTARGDKSLLSPDEIRTLENHVLPTARRWMNEIRGLADQGQRTLAYWGEC